MQRASVMNVNVSGGNLKIGAVIQGAVNKILQRNPVPNQKA